jgi:hypothetical protein
MQPTIEPLEHRIAPATLVDPSTVTYLDADGDLVTVTLSKPLFTAANVVKLFDFDTGAVDGNNAAAQFLETLNLTSLTDADTAGLSVRITVEPDTVAGGNGQVTVDYIDVSKHDLSAIYVDGNLQRFRVGDSDRTTPALDTLSVDTLGKTTPGSDQKVNSVAFGRISELSVIGDVTEAVVQITGGPTASVGSLVVGGSLIGGKGAKSGSFLSTGGFGSVDVGGSLVGGAGADSAAIQTGGSIGLANLRGSLLGAAGTRSASLLSTGPMGDVVLGGDLVGGAGADSGQIATGNTLGMVQIDGDMLGGAGKFSGSVLSAKGTASVSVTGAVRGGAGADSAQIGTAGNIGPVTVDQLVGGQGKNSGSILSTGNMGAVEVIQDVLGGSADRSGHIGAAGNLAAVTVGGSLIGSTGSRGGTIQTLGFLGAVAVGGDVLGGAGKETGRIAGMSGISSVAVTGNFEGGAGFESGQIDAGRGTISGVNIGGFFGGGTGAASGVIFAGLDIMGINIGGGLFDATIVSRGYLSSLVAGEGILETLVDARSGIGSVDANASLVESSGIADSLFVTEGSIPSITGRGADPDGVGGGGTTFDGIVNSRFVARLGFGVITGTTTGTYSGDNGIDSSVFRSRSGGIGGITASTDSHGLSDSGSGAITMSGFNAYASIGPISTAGHISGSIFIAGIDLGTDFIPDPASLQGIDGPLAFDTAMADRIGFGGGGTSKDTPNASSASIGSLVLNPPGGAGAAVLPVIDESVFLAGVTGAGADRAFGTPDDPVTAGSEILAINSPGGVLTSHFESGRIVSLDVADGTVTGTSFNPNRFLANDAGGSGIGPFNINQNTGTIAAFGFTELLSANGIANLQSISASEGAIFGVVLDGDSDSSGSGAVGDILGRTVGAAVDAISELVVRSGGGSDIGQVRAELPNVGQTGNAISNSTFLSGRSVALVDADRSVVDTLFVAPVSFGDIAIGGDLTNSKILAGMTLGADSALGGTGSNADGYYQGATVGFVTIGGQVIASDLASSVSPGADTIFGNGNDLSVGFGGSIGSVTIGDPAPPAGVLPDQNAQHAITALLIGPVTLGAQSVTPELVVNTIPNASVDPEDVRIAAPTGNLAIDP